ncbi:acyl-CoA carboxylase epsilon subunit [Streptomyces sp. NPDC048420]|uniref:acyl-CoA carboxylase epsilon subunit n=1 Tax=Streptomyces sp. NPDC048420 TaxID=3155755 RepID=UPI00342E876C
MTPATTPMVQIVKGELTEDELAALTAVLLARAAAARRTARTRPAHGGRHPRAGWRRLERVTLYRNPVSWH